jgi:hypothetical protein
LVVKGARTKILSVRKYATTTTTTLREFRIVYVQFVVAHTAHVHAHDASDCRCTQDLIARKRRMAMTSSLHSPLLCSPKVTTMFSTQQDYGANKNLNEEPASPYYLQESQNEGDEQQSNAVTRQTQRLYGAAVHVHADPASPYHLQEGRREEGEQQPQGNGIQDLDEEYEMSLNELLYSSSSYHAIVKPGTFECSPGNSAIDLDNM